MNQTPRFSTFLMFQNNDASEAMNFYVSLFPESKIHSVEYWPSQDEGPDTLIKSAQFSLMGQKLMCMDSPIAHNFNFTPSISFFINCQNQEEIQKLYEALAREGQILMELMNHGFSRQFAWVHDRFGISWQLNLP